MNFTPLFADAGGIRKEGRCVDQWYPPAPNAIVTEAGSDTNAKKGISSEKLPFQISNAKDVQVMSLDENQVNFLCTDIFFKVFASDTNILHTNIREVSIEFT